MSLSYCSQPKTHPIVVFSSSKFDIIYITIEKKLEMSAPFLLRNLPKSQRENVKNELRIKELEEELEFYKSIFKTHRNSAVFNLRIKTINGEKIWIDKIKISTEYNLLNSLDEDDEIREWKTPVRCSGWYD